jgi:four helix bundle protein
VKCERFEQLPVWQAAMALAEGVYGLTRRGAFPRTPELQDQARRAALSVSNNIAEGFERGTTAELLTFPYIARGSAGEVRSRLLLCDRLLDRRLRDSDGPAPPRAANRNSEISDLKSEVARLKGLAESCSRQLRAWADQLQNSDIQGQRRLNERGRRARDHARNLQTVRQKMQGIVDAAQRQRAQGPPAPPLPPPP